MSSKNQEVLNSREINRVIEMAWEDRTPFEAIEFQFGLSEKEVIQLMKRELKLQNWKKWRARVQGRKTNTGSQQRFFTGDVGFEFSALTLDDLKWGRS